MGAEKRFALIRSRLESCGWLLARIRGSHHVFTKPGRLPISIPVHRGKVKAIYVRKVDEILKDEEEGRSPKRPGQ